MTKLRSERRRVIRLAVSALAAFAAMAGHSLANAADCSTFARAVDAARNASDAAAATKHYEAAEAALACSADDRARMGRVVAYAYYRQAFSGERPAEERRRLLEKGLTYGQPWELLASAADAAAEARQFEAATKLYQEALDDIRNTQLNPNAPPNAVIAAIFSKAQEARLLAPQNVATPVARDGLPSGLGCTNFRGFTTLKVALPIEFEYDSVTFTAKGSAAAKDLADQLRRQKPPRISLIGHTDQRGKPSYNQSLSERRAAAVKAFLAQQGVASAVEASGRGESEPFKFGDPSQQRPQTDIDQINRRVELDRQASALCGAP